MYWVVGFFYKNWCNIINKKSKINKKQLIMKLELKNILNHVINECIIEVLNYKCDYVGIQYSNANGYYYLNNELHITYDGGSTGKSLKEIKFLLRPLSDLTKEIDVNGEKFVPKLELNELCRNLPFYRVTDFRLFGIDEVLSDFRSEYDLMDIYNVIQKLLEWHFDIYGLIPSGLAIDINTLNK
jgi:hypothetical protein